MNDESNLIPVDVNALVQEVALYVGKVDHYIRKIEERLVRIREEMPCVTPETTVEQLFGMMERPTKRFVDTLKSLLRDGECTVLDFNQTVKPYKGRLIGYKDVLNFYFVPGDTYEAVLERLNREGCPLSIGKNVLLRQLRSEGISVANTGSETLLQVRRNGVHGRFLAIPRATLNVDI